MSANAARLWRRVDGEVAGVAVCGLCAALGTLGGWLGWPATLATGLYLAAIVAGGLHIVPRGLRGLIRDRSLDINVLVAVAVAGAVLLGEWGEGATVVFLFAVSEALEGFTLARTRRSIQALLAVAPETARLMQPNGPEREVPVEAVPVGAVVAVRPGDRVPLDGVVTLGESAVDQAPITGESVPVDKHPGDQVFGGTLNGSGYLEVRTTRPFTDSTIARIVHLVEAAQSAKAPSQRFVERFARAYTPLVVLGAVLVAALPPLAFGQPFAPWFDRALVMLLIACPCALVIATPVAVVAAIGNASRHGVLIKGGASLERAGGLRAVALDKTGTLTLGTPEVQRIVPLNGLVEADLLRLAAAAEARSEHPLAAAIVRAAARQGLRRLPPVEGFRAVAGQGVQALVAGRALAIGKPAWVESAGAALGAARPVLAELAAAGQTPVVVARWPHGGPIGGPHGGPIGGPHGAPAEVVGVIAVADELRPTAAETVAALRRTGVQRVVLVTGDNAATARAVAARAGIAPADVYAEVLPEGKVAVIKRLVQQHRQAAMVGDGVNDAPALAAATVGIAMGAGGSDVALETADVALVGNDLTRLPRLLQLSRQTARTIQVNIGVALLVKAVVLALAALGVANLWLAIAGDTGATVLVILNGMRLLGKPPPARLADVAAAAAARRRCGLEAEAAPAACAAHAH